MRTRKFGFNFIFLCPFKLELAANMENLVYIVLKFLTRLPTEQKGYWLISRHIRQAYHFFFISLFF